jgi:arylsulfatase A-like enzyme
MPLQNYRAASSRLHLHSIALLGAVGLVALAASFPRSARAAETTSARRPNVLFILADDQRFDTIGALGNADIQTPTLDRLAARGFVFTNAYCQGGMISAVCAPSRTMLMTGRSLFHIPIPWTKSYNGPTLGGVFGAAGYATLHVGKKGNSFTVGNEAFQKVIYCHSGKAGPEEQAVQAQRIADAAIDFLRQHKGDRPFFIYLAPQYPHDPRIAPDEFHRRYDPARIPLPRNFLPEHPFDNGDLRLRDELLAPFPRTPDVMKRHLADYYACITCLDHHLGRILDVLRETGHAEDTIVVFTSDQGLAVGGRHGLMGKQNLYEEFKSPLLLAGPGIPHGRSEALVYLFDLFPTCCALAGVPIPKGLEGANLVPILKGETPRVRDWLFAAYKDCQRMVRDQRWKLLWYPKMDRFQLFDLANDPWEMNDLVDKPEYQTKIVELTKRLAEQQAFFDDDRAPAATAVGQGRDSALCRRLKAQLRTVPAIDTHAHLYPLEQFPGYVETKQGRGINLAALWRNSYFPWENPLTPWQPGSSFDDWWAKAKHDFPNARATGVYRSLLPAFRDLYGLHFDRLSDEQARELNDRVFYNYLDADKGKRWIHEVIAQRANIELMLIDPFWSPFDFERHYAFAVPVLRIDPLVRLFYPGDFPKPEQDPYRFAKQHGLKVESLDDYLTLINRVFREAKEKGTVCLKCGLAYRRSLRFENVSKERAARSFSKPRSELTLKEIKEFEDFLVWELARLSAKYDMPFQFHTGLARIQGSNPLLLVDLIEGNPRTKFILFHGGYPWTHETGAIVMQHRNTWIDANWLPTLSRSMAKQAFHQWLEVVPSDRITVGTDNVHAEGTYGALEIVRLCIAEVLAEKVESGNLTEEDALRIGRQILRDNALKLFPTLRQRLWKGTH